MVYSLHVTLKLHADLLGWRPKPSPQNIVISAANADYCAMNQGLQKVLRLSKPGQYCINSLQSVMNLTGPFWVTY